MKNKKILLLLVLFCTVSASVSVHGQAVVGREKTTIEAGALLELTDKVADVPSGEDPRTTADRGMGLPRVTLEVLTELRPCITTALNATEKLSFKGLSVYNVADATPFKEGIYTWDGAQWEFVASEANPIARGTSAFGRGMYPTDILSMSDEAMYLPNSYMLTPNNTTGVTIDVAKAFAVWNYYTPPNQATNPFNNQALQALIDGGQPESVVLLWKDVPGVTGADDFIKFTTNGIGRNRTITVTSGGQKGNAVIAYRIGGIIYWSWHIWVSDYVPPKSDMGNAFQKYDVPGGSVYKYNNKTEADNYTGTSVYMDRNLGARSAVSPNSDFTIPDSYGLLYQWGRKDPFVGADTRGGTSGIPIYNATGDVLVEYYATSPAPAFKGVALTEMETNGSFDNNLANAIRTPMAYFVKNSTVHADWYTAESDYNYTNASLWDENGRKTPFDPCPEGWRVPSFKNGYSPWYYGVDTSNGTSADYGGTWYYGQNFTGKADYMLGYYPSAGLRDGRGTSIGISSAGTISFLWTANSALHVSVPSKNVFYMSSAGNIFPDHPTRLTTNGGSVRCVQE